MKICFVTTIASTLQCFVLETAKYLHNECGWDVTLICAEDKSFAAGLPDYVRYIPVHMARGIDMSALKSIRELKAIFRREQFDIIQYSTPNAACYASIAAKAIHAPIRLYCQWGIRYTGMSGFSRKIFKTIEKMVCRKSTIIRAVSPQNMAFAVKEGLYPASKAKVVGRGGTIGVDMKHFDLACKDQWRTMVRERFGIGHDDFVFGFAGRINADKGCAELLTAFRTLPDNSNAKLLLVGPLEDNCGIDAELIAWARSSDKVVLTGSIPNANMREYYAAMDTLVHPTYREGFGMVIQEAAGLAVPVITTRIPGASEVMEDGVSCLLVEPRNAAELADTMHHLSAHPDEAAKIGHAAYDMAAKYYDRPVMLENQRRDYLSIAGQA